jgi:hypothetical protein
MYATHEFSLLQITYVIVSAEPDVTPAVDPRDALHAAELLTAAADPQDT